MSIQQKVYELLKISIEEVAKEAGVSASTVSRVLSGSRVSIAPETRHRVQQIAESMGYVPNRAARALAKGSSQTIAIWAAHLRSRFTGLVVHYMSQELARHKYDMMIMAAQYDQDAPLNSSHLMSWQVDGIIALDVPRGVVPSLKGSRLGDKPFATLGGYVVDRCDYVHVEFKNEVITAVRHLHSGGARRIAYLAPDWFEWFRQINDARLSGYDTAVNEIGLPAEYILTPNQKRETTGDALKAYIESHGCPDGIFCYNDDMAIAAYRALRDIGRRIPEDVALVGCDGIDDTLYLDAPLSTIVQPIEHMCLLTWMFLEKRIRIPDTPLQQVTVQPKLEIRQSSMR